MELAICEVFDLQNNLLVYRETGEKVPRPMTGFVKFRGKLLSTKVIFAALLKLNRDKRTTEGMGMARKFPDLKLLKREAVALGIAIYRTGRPCKRGHESWRYVSNGGCLKCLGKL